jgi:hypothetical protein
VEVRVRTLLLSALALVAAGLAAPSHARTPAAPMAADLRLVSALDARAELTSLDSTAPDEKGHDPSRMFLLSLAVPGAGQVVQGEKRGYIYLATEIALWAGFFALNGKGLDERAEYEDYADAHWDSAGYYAWYDANCVECAKERASDYECRPLAVPGTQEYYEDIGKYDTYWRWWSYSGSGPSAPEEYLDVRNEYWGMRGQSNHHLRQARYSMTAAFLNHLVSSVDSFLSARRGHKAGGETLGGNGPEPRILFDTASGGDGLRCALVVSH